ncbi:hypothetical protein, partial [Methylovulum sp.]|uniref:hypothetical protein n=1 Tax=Methylovulum sp. TaxID=1916980 RepID=UPI00262875CF
MEILILLFGILLLHPCAPILSENKPAIKADQLKRFAMGLFYLGSIKHFAFNLIPVIKEYGSPYFGIISVSWMFSVVIFMVLLSLGLLIRSSMYYAKLIPISLALVGIPKQCALPVLYKTLKNMGLNYQESVAQIKLPDQGIEIAIELTDKEMRFAVEKTIDKIFLQRFCENYQNQYQAEKLPLEKGKAMFIFLLGLLLTLVAIYDIAIDI